MFLEETHPPSNWEASPSIDDVLEVAYEQSKIHRGATLDLFVNIGRHLSVPALVEQGAKGYKTYDGGPRLALPEPGSLSSPLSEVLLRRSSASDEAFVHPVSLQDLATLLHHSWKSTRATPPRAAPTAVIHKRPYPSAGALYPIEFYVVMARVEGITPCIAHYAPHSHELTVIRALPRGLPSPLHFRDLTEVPITIVLTSVFRRSVKKYGPRGYRFAILEAGHATQNLCLVATALGLRNVVWGGFFDDELHDLLGVDGVSEAVVSCALIDGQNKPSARAP